MAIDINLQPTDRCILKSIGIVKETLTEYSSHKVIASENIGSIINPDTGITQTLYKGTVTVSFTKGKIIEVVDTFSDTSLASASVTYTENSYTVTVKSSLSSKSYNIPVTITYQVESEGEIEQEVFQIKDSSGNYMWFKKKPITITFDTEMIESIEFEESAVIGGGASYITEPGVYYVYAGGFWRDLRVLPKSGYTIISNDVEDWGGCDLSDLANLTYTDFNPVALVIEAELDGIDPSNAIIDEGIIRDSSLQMLEEGSVHVVYREYVDADIAAYDEDVLQEGPRGGDVFVAYGYKIPAWSSTRVPVIYKTDFENQDVIDEGLLPDYEDTYYYMGQENVNGQLYDKWRKIDTDLFSDTGENTAKKYIYTDVITRDKLAAPEINSVTTYYNEDTSVYVADVSVTNPNSEHYATSVKVHIVMRTYNYWGEASLDSGSSATLHINLGTATQLQESDVVAISTWLIEADDPTSIISYTSTYDTSLSS